MNAPWSWTRITGGPGKGWSGWRDPVLSEAFRARCRVRVAGIPDTAHSLTERKERYRVPGVSLAVIDGGRVVLHVVMPGNEEPMVAERAEAPPETEGP